MKAKALPLSVLAERNHMALLYIAIANQHEVGIQKRNFTFEDTCLKLLRNIEECLAKVQNQLVSIPKRCLGNRTNKCQLTIRDVAS